jgi:hypothetical protein
MAGAAQTKQILYSIVSPVRPKDFVVSRKRRHRSAILTFPIGPIHHDPAMLLVNQIPQPLQG